MNGERLFKEYQMRIYCNYIWIEIYFLFLQLIENY